MWKSINERNKSYYKKFFSSFLIVLFVPMVTVILIFGMAQDIVKEQIVVSSKNVLNQFFRNVDNVLTEGQEICVSVANDSKCRLFAPYVSDDFKRRTYLAYEIQQLLGGYRSEKYADIFVYFPEKDYVISEINAAGSLEFYYELCYADQNISFEEFRTIVKSAKGKPALCSMNGKNKDSYLCITMKTNRSKNEQYNYVVVIVLKPGYIETLMQGVEGDNQNGTSMIFDASKQLIRYTGDSDNVFHLDGFNEENDSYNESFGSSEYIMYVRQSDALEAYYAYGVPRDYFWKRLLGLYIVSGIGFTVTGILGIWVVRRQTKKTYEPLGEIVGKLQKQGQKIYDANAYTEFEFIEAIFKKEEDEKLALNKSLQKGEKQKRDSFIFSILNGNANITQKTEDYFAENGMKLCSDRFCIVLLRIEQNGSFEPELVSFVVSNIFEELCNQVGRGYIVDLRGSKYVLMVNLYREAEKEQLGLLLEEGKGFFHQKYGMGMTMGMSTVQMGLYGIRMAYEEAGHALEYSYLLGKEMIIDYSDIAKREFKYLQTADLKVLHVIIDYLSGKEEGAEAIWLVDDLLDDYGIDGNASLYAMECFKFEVIAMLHRIMIQEGYWTPEWKERVLKLSNRDSLDDFKECFADILQELYQKNKVKEVEEDVCEKVKEYIEQHYGEEQLTRTSLGELFGIAPGYLSTLFKEKYQFTIPEYITKTRIDYAKVQLRETEDTIQEIAGENGFVNNNSFTRAFKRQEGMTPSAYRELFRKK